MSHLRTLHIVPNNVLPTSMLLRHLPAPNASHAFLTVETHSWSKLIYGKFHVGQGLDTPAMLVRRNWFTTYADAIVLYKQMCVSEVVGAGGGGRSAQPLTFHLVSDPKGVQPFRCGETKLMKTKTVWQATAPELCCNRDSRWSGKLTALLEINSLALTRECRLWSNCQNCGAVLHYTIRVETSALSVASASSKAGI